MKIANVQEMVLLTNPTSGSILEDPFKWYHISTHGINHTRWWFHKWSSTLSDHQVKQVSSNTRAQAYQMDDPCYDIGGGVPPIGIKVTRSYTWCLKSYTSSVHQKYEIQVSTFYPNSTLCIKKMHTFYGNWWQRGRDWYKHMKYARGIKEVGFGHGYGQRGSNIEELRRIKILVQEKHKFYCIWHVHIHVLACIA